MNTGIENTQMPTIQSNIIHNDKVLGQRRYHTLPWDRGDTILFPTHEVLLLRKCASIGSYTHAPNPLLHVWPIFQYRHACTGVHNNVSFLHVVPPSRTMLNLSISGAPMYSLNPSTPLIKNAYKLPYNIFVYCALLTTGSQIESRSDLATIKIRASLAS